MSPLCPRVRRAPQALVAVALAGAACAAPKEAWRQPGAEAFVDVLPQEAVLSVDGAVIGSGSHAVPVPDRAHVYVLRAQAPGFPAAERSATGAQLAGARIGLVLRPPGFGEARRLDLDDGIGLASAGALLERTGRHEAALQYAERAVDAAPEAPKGYRVLGDAARALKQRKRAIQAYSSYLQLAPDAPDRAAVARAVEELRGDMTIPAQIR